MKSLMKAGLSAALCTATIAVAAVYGQAQDTGATKARKPNKAVQVKTKTVAKPATKSVAQEKPVEAPANAEIGKPFRDFTLRDIASDTKNATFKFSDYKGKKAIVGVFMAQYCGTTWQYEERTGKLLKDYGNKDVVFVAIHSNFREQDAEIKGMLEQRNLTMPLLDDKPNQALADYVGARVTPTFFVIDKKGILKYIGAFDNRANSPDVAYVRPALDALLSGKEVAVKTSRTFG